jgi:alpha-1,2-mannosyltransferase
VPDWVLVPGVVALVAALAACPALRGISDLDFNVYYSGGTALRHGRALYEGALSGGLPFTYTPFAAGLFAVSTAVSRAHAARLMLLGSLAALVVTAWLLVGWLGARRLGRLGVAAGLSAVALWLEPVHTTLVLGQINLLILVAVCFDLSRPDDRWYKGIGVGLATAIKLTPAVFIVYLLVTRRWRAFWVSSATMLASIVAGFLVSPRDSAVYWGGAFIDGGRIAGVTPMSFADNQSLHGLAVRLAHGHRTATPLWLALAAAVLVVGFAIAVRATRLGEQPLAVATVGLVGLLVSPVSWSHHWVWAIVVLVVAADLFRRLLPSLSLGAQMAGVAVPLAVLLILFEWPVTRPPGGPQVPTSLLWQQPFSWVPLADEPEYHWTLWQWLGGESYVLFAVALLVIAGWLTVRAGKAASLAEHTGSTIGQAPAPQARPSRTAAVGQGNSELADADAADVPG